MLKPFVSGLLRQASRLMVAGVLALTTSPAQAEYMGGGAIYNPSSACTWPTGVEMTRARYVPNVDDTANSIVTLNFAVGGVNSYGIRGDLSGARTWRRSAGRSVWGELYRMTATPSVRVLSRSDAIYNGNDSIDLDRDDIRLVLRIRNFNGERGCQVTTALMLRRWN